MPSRRIRVLLAVAVVAAPLAATATASAVGQGTFTKITTPSHDTTITFDPNGTNSLSVAGQTSADVSSVDIDCYFRANGVVNTTPLATNVPVTNGAFSTIGTIASINFNCRLMAIPSTGVDTSSDYLGSYTGPILYIDALVPTKSNGIVVDFTATGEEGTGFAQVKDANCGVSELLGISTPSMDMVGTGSPLCTPGLPFDNVTGSSAATASGIVVDGHNAYLPFGVAIYLDNERGLGLTPTALHTTFSRHASGDITVVESAPLVRCSDPDNVYPPTPASCPSLTPTGITFRRSIDVVRSAHQVRLRDSYISADAKAHVVHADYLSEFVAPLTGALGYAFPGGGSAFTTSSPDEVVLGLGTKAATVLVRSDLRSQEGNPAADTVGLTWSRAPSKLQFEHDFASFFFAPYVVKVPAAGSAYLGFAVSESVTTSGVKSLATAAVRDMMVAPTITSPKAGATIRGHHTTVKGIAFLGANGLPTSVTVNGHKATLTKLSGTRESYAVTFSETFGKHTLTVTARDSAGNAVSVHRTVRNVAP